MLPPSVCVLEPALTSDIAPVIVPLYVVLLLPFTVSVAAPAEVMTPVSVEFPAVADVIEATLCEKPFRSRVFTHAPLSPPDAKLKVALEFQALATSVRR